LTRAIVPACAAAVGLVTVFVVPRSDLPLTTYAGASRSAEAADLVAGLGLVSAGVLVWILRPGSRFRLPAIAAAGLAWFAPDWAGWEGSPAVRSIGTAVEPLFLAFAVYLILAGSGIDERSRRGRLAVAGLYVAAVFASLGRALVRDPFLDPSCWNNCIDNVFLVVSRPGAARALETGWIYLSAVVGVLLVVTIARQMASATRAARATRWPILMPGLVLGAGIAARAIALVRVRHEHPQDPLFSAVYQVIAWSTAALALGLVWVAVRGWRARVAVARLASDLGEAPALGSFGLALSRATRDASLEVVYPLPEGDRCVTASGAPVETPVASGDRAVTPIVRDGTTVAFVVHDSQTVDAEQLRTEIGAAARLAVENDRLQAEVLAQLKDLRASQARVVEAGDDERRRLERNLHDGAQQRMLAVVFDLRLARAEAGSHGDRELATLLASAEHEARVAIGELRGLARGIYPAILTDGGIGPAMKMLAETSRVPVEVLDTAEGRFPAAVERTAFVAVAEAIEAASREGSGGIAVRASADGDRLVVEIEGSGSDPLPRVVDRVGALGGDIRVVNGVQRVELPCG
jgi:signal transduction histidine kinase